MLGTGEYTTGWVGKASDSDKSTGVVALVMLDLKRRNKILKRVKDVPDPVSRAMKATNELQRQLGALLTAKGSGNRKFEARVRAAVAAIADESSVPKKSMCCPVSASGKNKRPT